MKFKECLHQIFPAPNWERATAQVIKDLAAGGTVEEGSTQVDPGGGEGSTKKYFGSKTKIKSRKQEGIRKEGRIQMLPEKVPSLIPPYRFLIQVTLAYMSACRYEHIFIFLIYIYTYIIYITCKSCIHIYLYSYMFLFAFTCSIALKNDA